MSTESDLMIVLETLALPWLDATVRRAGFQPRWQRSVRQAIGACRQRPPRIVLAEYHFNPTYSSFTSNLESLLAGLQKYAPHARLIVTYPAHRRTQLQAIQSRFPIAAILAQPLTAASVSKCLAGLNRPQRRS